MIIIPKNGERARQAAKSLKTNLEQWNVQKPLTWHQDTVASMMGHKNWAALLDAMAGGAAPSALDDDIEDEELQQRRSFQGAALIGRLDPESMMRAGGLDVYETIARHVAVSGTPKCGTAFETHSVTIEDGTIRIPLDMDHFTEDALFVWKDLPRNKNFDHVAAVYDAGAEAVYSALVYPFPEEALAAAREFQDTRPADSLDSWVLTSMIFRMHGELEKAHDAIDIAYQVGSYAWSHVARSRRRRHDRVKWWDEPETRPFMRVVVELASVLLQSDTDESFAMGIQFLKTVRALNTADPLGVVAFGDRVMANRVRR